MPPKKKAKTSAFTGLGRTLGDAVVSKPKLPKGEEKKPVISETGTKRKAESNDENTDYQPVMIGLKRKVRDEESDYESSAEKKEGESMGKLRQCRKVVGKLVSEKEMRELKEASKGLGDEMVVGWSNSGRTRGHMLYGAGKRLGRGVDGDGGGSWKICKDIDDDNAAASVKVAGNDKAVEEGKPHRL